MAGACQHQPWLPAQLWLTGSRLLSASWPCWALICPPPIRSSLTPLPYAPHLTRHIAAAAVAAGNIDQAAQLIAQSLTSGTEVLAAATALATTAGTTAQLTQAVSLAVTKYGADATAAARALSEVGAAALPACKERWPY